MLPDEGKFQLSSLKAGSNFLSFFEKEFRSWIEEKMPQFSKQGLTKFVLSGHQIPGEGEFKLLEFVSFERSQADYDPNDTSYLLVTNDSDGIVLGLNSHEPNFSILREEVYFLFSIVHS